MSDNPRSDRTAGRADRQDDDRYVLLTETPVPQLICRLAVPTVISMLVTGIYSSADTFFVGRISTQATAAVGLAFSVMAVIQALGFMCGHGSGNYLSRMLGAARQREAEEMAATGFALALLIGAAVAAGGNLRIDSLCRLIGASDTTLADTRSYLRIILLGAPLMTGQFVINNQLRFQGKAVYAMAGLLCGAVINIALDPILMFGCGLGTAGAALATVSGQLISFCVLLAGSFHGENIRLRLGNVRLNAYYIGQILNGGLPSLFRQGLAAAATMLLNTSAARFGGDAAVAGMSVVTRVMALTSSALIGFGQGYQPVCSFNYGAARTDRVKEGFWFCVRGGTLFLIAGGALCDLFAPQIIAFFRNDPEVVRIGADALRWQATVLPVLGFTVMSNMMLQSIGSGLKASICSSARSGIFFIPLILILPRVLGLQGVIMTQALADLSALLLTIPLALSELRKM